MAATPPPPKRVRTPPTPLHGAKLDDHDAFSPRRSNRISTMRNTSDTPNSPDPIHTQNHISRKSSTRKAPNFAISPPSSPSSPRNNAKSSGSSRKAKGVSFAGKGAGHDRVMPEPDSDIEIDETMLHSKRRVGGNMTGMLPTPVKTPKKRGLTSQAQLNSTARVLFPNRPADTNDLMPSPRKSRKARKHHAYTLESFAEECDNDQGDDIPIYTDTKEQIPMEDDAEDNPFVTRKSTRKTRSEDAPEPSRRTKTKSKYGMGEEVDRAVDNNEGMVYVFRGRKVFRKFDDVEDNGPTDPTDPNIEALRRAGVSGRFTRSSIQPRLLFPPKEDPASSNVDADEEAVTDIEGAGQTTSDEKEVVTPVKQHFRPMTPPTSLKKTRKPPPIGSSDSSPNGYDGAYDRHLKVPEAHGKRPSPFDTWSRSKSGKSSGGPPSKRQAEPMEGDRGDKNAPTGKRSRSGPVMED